MNLKSLNIIELIKIINKKDEYIKELENKLSFIVELYDEEENDNLIIWS